MGGLIRNKNHRQTSVSWYQEASTILLMGWRVTGQFGTCSRENGYLITESFTASKSYRLAPRKYN